MAQDNTDKIIGKLLDKAAKAARPALLEAWQIAVDEGCGVCFSEWVGETMAERLFKYTEGANR